MNYATLEQREDVVIIWMDQEGESVNKISPTFIAYFERLMHEIDADDRIRAIVLASRKKDWIAGADLEFFSNNYQAGTWKPIGKRSRKLLGAMEASVKPIVAAIDGAALGAGCEIALACHYRIISDSKHSMMGLPEVKLGLLPAGGGTQRLPRLIGLQSALDMMLTGKNIYPGKAKKMGLVDEVVSKGALIRSAVEQAKSMIIKHKPGKKKKGMSGLLENNMIGQSVILRQARKMVEKQTKGNYPAPFKILECVEIGLKKGEKAGYKAEAKKFDELLCSAEAKELIQIFFNMTDLKKNPMQHLARPVQRIGMVGAGFMGAGIAEVSAKKDVAVILKDIKETTIASAKKTVWKNLSKAVSKKAMSPFRANQVMNHISGQMDYRNFHKVDIVIEAVFEDVKLKRKILAEVEAEMNPQCIFATNTSALPIKDIALMAKNPEQIIGLHYFSPVPKMPLLEIVVTDQTADWVIATCLDLGIKQGKTCIVVKDGPGFYTTRILAVMLNEALLLLEEGADIKELDSFAQQFGFPVGPVTLMDEVGIDVGAHILSGELTEYIKQRGNLKMSTKMIDMYRADYHGRKNRKGFYLYGKDGKKDKGKVNPAVYNFFGGKERKEMDQISVRNRLAMAMVNEAALCLEEGIIQSARDGDIGAVFGLGFPPFRGGPFRYLDSMGADSALSILEMLSERHGPRFSPAQIIRDKSQSAQKFYA